MGSNKTYERLWSDGIGQLQQLCPLDRQALESFQAPDAATWARLYLGYLKAVRELEEAHHWCSHPQRRPAVHAALLAALGRLLEVRAILDGIGEQGAAALAAAGLELRMAPAACEVPVPRCFREDRQQELAERDKALAALQPAANPAAVKSGQGPGSETQQSAVAAAAGSSRPEQQQQIAPQLSLREPLSPVQTSEPSSCARDEAEQPHPEHQPAAQAAAHAESVQEAAAVRIQAALRGHLCRKATRHAAAAELRLLHMVAADISTADAAREARLEASCGQKRAALVQAFALDSKAARRRLKELEGPRMRNDIQQKVHAWWLATKDPLTGKRPYFPGEEMGGSLAVLSPPAAPPPPTPPPGTAGRRGGANSAAAAPAAAQPARAGRKPKMPPPERPKLPAASLLDVEAALAAYAATWAAGGQPCGSAQRPDDALMQAELRPQVFEEVRREVDPHLREVMARLQVDVERQALADAVAAGGAGSQAKKGKGDRAQAPAAAAPAKGKQRPQSAAAAAADGTKPAAKKGKAKKKKIADPVAEMAPEALKAELAAAGILKPCPAVQLRDCVGGLDRLAPPQPGRPPPWPAVRASLAATCILPLACAALHSRVPAPRAVMLVGAPGSGKSAAAAAMAHAAGAAFIDLSPRNTDGQYPGKAAQAMVRMAVRAARILAPAVVYVDECEKVFVTDKRKIKTYGGQEPFGRIRKTLLAEVAALQPEDRVMVIGESSMPQTCIKNDEVALMTFFRELHYIPLPDHCGRQALWRAAFTSRQLPLPQDFPLLLQCTASEGFTPADIMQVVSGAAANRVQGGCSELITMTEIAQLLAAVTPTDAKELETLETWYMSHIKWTPPPPPVQTEGKDGKGSKAAAGNRQGSGK